MTETTISNITYMDKQRLAHITRDNKPQKEDQERNKKKDLSLNIYKYSIDKINLKIIQIEKSRRITQKGQL